MGTLGTTSQDPHINFTFSHSASHKSSQQDQSTISAAETSPKLSRAKGDHCNYESSFPTKSYLPSTISSTQWPSLQRLLPMSDPGSIAEMVQALRTHRVNTLAELRRIERILAVSATADVSEVMTKAWAYYVNSNMLLTELRSLTRNYPFNSDCLDDAKNRVYSDPYSNRSWNFCWLVLTKIKTDALIPSYAQYQASLPAMWGNQIPTAHGVQQLANAFVVEWNWAVDQMLRHWERPPVGGAS